MTEVNPPPAFERLFVSWGTRRRVRAAIELEANAALTAIPNIAAGDNENPERTSNEASESRLAGRANDQLIMMTFFSGGIVGRVDYSRKERKQKGTRRKTDTIALSIIPMMCPLIK